MGKIATLRPLIALLSLLGAVTCYAQERILSYHSEISIAQDATMVVEETIRVNAEGEKIRRGIYRDILTTYEDAFGNSYIVDLEILDVSRDGVPEPWHTSEIMHGVRVYVGSSDTLLKPGEYSYTFRYKSNRMVGYFDDHDELYWNVTSTRWNFRIEEASATVSLPGSVSAEQIRMEGYTGRDGENGQNYAKQVGDGGATIVTTRYLDSQEGLTLVMSWPKGIVREPDKLERAGLLLRDNLGLLLSLLALSATMIYLYLAWSKYGRDPEAGVIFPHYEPPKGYSPALARCILKMGYDDKALTAAVINLAVKGHLSIISEDKEYTLRQQKSDEKMAPGEAVLLKTLFSQGSILVLEDKNHMVIGSARSAHAKALKRDYLNVYFSRNSKLLLPSLLSSVVLFIVIIVLNAFVPLVIAAFGIILVLHIVFAFLLKAPSTKGRLLMDKLEGFKLYLEVAEKDDMNLRNPPDMNAELFERFLPFAIALGVEQDWSEQFTQVFATLLARDGVEYQPHWYHGHFNYLHMGSFTSTVSSNFSTAIASAASPPGSTSGAGGGGFSGGGGGGGGGGGW